MILKAKVRETQTTMMMMMMMMMMIETERDSCASVVYDSLQLHGPQPARFLCPWNFPSNNTRMGCRALLQGIFPTCISCLLHWQVGSLPLALPRKPLLMIFRSKQLYFRIDIFSFWSVLCWPINESGLSFYHL